MSTIKSIKAREILMVTTIIFGIIGSMLYLSCKSTPTTPPDIELPTKLLPAYTLDIKYPAEGASVDVERGGSVTLPVTVRSLVDEPIKIRLNLTAVYKVPEFVQFETEKEYRTWPILEIGLYTLADFPTEAQFTMMQSFS